MNAPSALLLVDLQEDFLRRPGLEPHRESLAAAATALLEDFRRRGAAVGHAHTLVGRALDQRMPHWKESGLWMCEAGTPGAQPPPHLAPAAGEPVFAKQGFLPGDPAELLDWARRGGQGRVVLAGVMTHACIQALASLLHSHGIRVALARDALGSDRPLHAAAAAEWMGLRGIPWWEWEAGTCPSVSREAFHLPPFQPRPWPELRCALLHWAHALEVGASEWARRMVEEIGKPWRLGREEAAAAASWVRDVVRHRDAAVLERVEGGLRVRRVPWGWVAVITPWNNPLAIPAARLAAALAFGNAAVWKPSPRTPGINREFERQFREAGLPPELLTVAPDSAASGAALLRHPEIQAVAFSGSLARGREIQAVCAERMLACQLELGGNNAAVVDGTADMEAAAEAITLGALTFSGQRCTANRRAIVLPEAAAPLRAALVRAFTRLRPGNPRDESTVFGPVVDGAAARRIEALLERARGTCRVARFHESARDAWDGTFVPAALVEEAPQDSEMVQEETFGPVLVLQVARDWEHALELANGVKQGLVAALFSAQDTRWEDFQRRMRAGVLKRGVSTAGPVPGGPFGGWKHSGWGGAEHAEADCLFFTRLQTIESSP